MSYKCGIYKIKNIINGKVYIGQSVQIEIRWNKHKKDLRENVHFNRHLQSAWNKYGEESFQFTIIEELDRNSDLLNDRETYWKLFYDNLKGTYNLGNTGNVKTTSSETRARISEGVKRRNAKRTPEQRKIKCRRKNPYKPWTKDKKEQAVLKTRETKIKNKTLGKTYIRTNEILEKQDKKRDSLRKAVICFDLNMNALYFYKSISEAARKLNFDEPAIGNCCRGIRKRVHNFIFKYAEDVSEDIIENVKNYPKDPFKNKIPVSYKYQNIKTKSRTTSIIQFDLNMKPLKLFNSIVIATKETGCSANGISHCCKGYQNKTGNFIFKYLKDVDENIIKELLQNES